MAKQAQRAKPQTAPGKGGGAGKGRLLTTGLLMIPVVVVLLPTCVLLLIGMVPTVVAYMVDRTREKFLAITVGLLNFCGALPGIFELWAEGQAYDVAMSLATDPLFWLTSYGGAALGWIVYLALPALIGSYYAMTSGRRVQMLKKRQAELIQSWGEEVAGAEQADSAGAQGRNS